MAFTWAGDLNGAMPIKRYFDIGATIYQGQLAVIDETGTTGGYVAPCAVAATANPDTGQHIVGICTGIVTTPVYTASYYNGDKGTYSATQATIAAYDPVGPAKAEVVLVTPTTLIRAPIWHHTPGTALTCNAATAAVSNGLTFTVATIDTSISSYSTAYCRTGANAKQYRKITTGGTTTQTVVLPFTYGIAAGDTFVVANVVEGWAHFDWLATYVNGIDGTIPQTSYAFHGYVHELNLEVSGREYAVFTLAAKHLMIGSGV